MTAGPAEPSAAAPQRPLRALARIRSGPVPLDFDLLAARIPAVLDGLALAGDADLELRLACTGPQELREVTAELLRCGAAQVRVEFVLRALARRPDGPSPSPSPPPPPAPRPAALVPETVRSATP
ncbi:hypothetical protein [Kitasatospora sp. MBT63]|uniref:hypothetical protein n=1 Tax=Kitasatospora sp. MBT63 TaxID=1444768 RepID=UPI00053AEA17|nr:hypothetical protein [Kitasatospora sp. MBT63]